MVRAIKSTVFLNIRRTVISALTVLEGRSENVNDLSLCSKEHVEIELTRNLCVHEGNVFVDFCSRSCQRRHAANAQSVRFRQGLGPAGRGLVVSAAGRIRGGRVGQGGGVPQAQGSVLARCGDLIAVRGKGHAADLSVCPLRASSSRPDSASHSRAVPSRLPVTMRLPSGEKAMSGPSWYGPARRERGMRGDVPYFCRVVESGERDAPAVRRKGCAPDFVLCSERIQQRSRLGVPQPCGLIVACGQDTCFVRRKHGSFHPLAMPAQCQSQGDCQTFSRLVGSSAETSHTFARPSSDAVSSVRSSRLKQIVCPSACARNAVSRRPSARPRPIRFHLCGMRRSICRCGNTPPC